MNWLNFTRFKRKSVNVNAEYEFLLRVYLSSWCVYYTISNGTLVHIIYLWRLSCIDCCFAPRYFRARETCVSGDTRHWNNENGNENQVIRRTTAIIVILIITISLSISLSRCVLSRHLFRAKICAGMCKMHTERFEEVARVCNNIVMIMINVYCICVCRCFSFSQSFHLTVHLDM